MLGHFTDEELENELFMRKCKESGKIGFQDSIYFVIDNRHHLFIDDDHAMPIKINEQQVDNLISFLEFYKLLPKEKECLLQD